MHEIAEEILSHMSDAMRFSMHSWFNDAPDATVSLSTACSGTDDVVNTMQCLARLNSCCIVQKWACEIEPWKRDFISTNSMARGNPIFIFEDIAELGMGTSVGIMDSMRHAFSSHAQPYPHGHTQSPTHRHKHTYRHALTRAMYPITRPVYLVNHYRPSPIRIYIYIYIYARHRPIYRYIFDSSAIFVSNWIC